MHCLAMLCAAAVHLRFSPALSHLRSLKGSSWGSSILRSVQIHAHTRTEGSDVLVAAEPMIFLKKLNPYAKVFPTPTHSWALSPLDTWTYDSSTLGLSF